jgi:hypothetical protein
MSTVPSKLEYPLLPSLSHPKVNFPPKLSPSRIVRSAAEWSFDTGSQNFPFQPSIDWKCFVVTFLCLEMMGLVVTPVSIKSMRLLAQSSMCQLHRTVHPPVPNYNTNKRSESSLVQRNKNFNLALFPIPQIRNLQQTRRNEERPKNISDSSKSKLN